jgi:transcriptional regulator with XRE-family HTH domain
MYESYPKFHMHEYLRLLRERKGLEMGEVEEMAGLSQGVVGMVESDQKVPTARILVKLASCYSVDLQEILSLLGYYEELRKRKLNMMSSRRRA